MSLNKLLIFFKENQHDVVDYWILDEKIKWIKVCNRKGGDIYMINIFSYNISLDGAEDIHYKTNRFLLYETDNPTMEMREVYTGLTQISKEVKNKFILVGGNEVCESENTWYKAHNLPKLNCYSLYMVIDLEWFYENVYVISHEIKRHQTNACLKICEFVQSALGDVNTFLKEDEQIKKCITKLMSKFQHNRKNLARSQQLYTTVCKDCSQTSLSLQKVDEHIHPNDMNFRSAVNRQYMRKKLTDKMDKLEDVKIGTISNICYFSGMKWNYLVQSMLLASRLVNLMKSIITSTKDAERL